MATRLFVGSLPYSVNDDQLQELFTEAGTVASAKVIMDRETNRSKGFGFVEMSTDQEADEAVRLFNGKEIDGRRITVSEARPPQDRGERRPYNSNSGGGGGGGGYGGGGGGGGARGGRRY